MTTDDGRLTDTEARITGVTFAYLMRCTSVGSALFEDILTRPRAGSEAEFALRDKDLMEPIVMAGGELQVEYGEGGVDVVRE